MERLNLGYSLKNIPIPTEDQYLKLLIARTEEFIQKIRWRTFFYLNPNAKTNHIETFGFCTSKTAPQSKELIPFENDLFQLISKVKLNKHKTRFQQQLNKDMNSLKRCKDVLVPADKTTNIYKVSVAQYSKLLHDNITKDYKKSSDEALQLVNTEAKTIAKNLQIDDRTEVYCQNPAYVTLKDHKNNFINDPKCRLINPAKSDIGRISKIKLQEINDNVRKRTSLQQWQSTGQVLSWFKALECKKTLQFLQFDICDFYPSISEELLDRALEYAKNFTDIDTNTASIIKNARKAFLFSTSTSPDQNLDIWTKKHGTFDVTMGAPDGAEVCETVGLFILHEITTQFPQLNSGIYRDDGLAAHKTMPGPELDRLRKDIIKLFQSYGLKITIEKGMKRVNFLDVRLDLENEKYSAYKKPNDIPLYIHKHSNHPPSIIRQLPKSINKRLNEISSEKNSFDAVKAEYQKALDESEYKHTLVYEAESKNKDSTHDKKRKNRKRKIIWYNPPFCTALNINIGHQFLQLIDTHFPKRDKLHKIFNRNTVKIGYCCTKNIQTIIKSHNRKVLNQAPVRDNEPRCNCRNKMECPLNGNCQQTDVVYQATIVNNKKKETKHYIGSTTHFKSRYAVHKSNFKNEKQKNATTLSSYLWENNLAPENITWKIISKAQSYKSGQKFCDLCLSEKLFIAKVAHHQDSLNKRSELAQKCRHKRYFKLALLKTEI